MVKVVDGVELLRMIRDKELKDGTKIKSRAYDKIFEFDKEKQNVYVEDSAEDLFDYMYLNEIIADKFEILSEEDEEIDIQSIEDLKYETIIEILGECDCWKGNELYCLKTFSKNDENLLKSNAENHKKINELLKAIKQLDKKIKEKE